MARQPGDLNPDDTYPPLDFGPGTPAARQMMNDIIALKKEAMINRSFRAGANRGDAASRASLADQINSVLRVSVGGYYGDALPVSFNGTTGVGGTIFWTSAGSEVIPEGFKRLSILNVLNVEAKFPALEPLFGFTYKINGVAVTGTSKITTEAFSYPGPLNGNPSPNITSVGRCDAREFDITGQAGLNFQAGYNVGFFSGAVPVANQTITPDVSGTFQIIYHN